MIENHSLAENIIKYHDHKDLAAMLGGHNLLSLRKSVNSPETRNDILKEANITDIDHIQVNARAHLPATLSSGTVTMSARALKPS